jgi:hypothetical protein
MYRFKQPASDFPMVARHSSPPATTSSACHMPATELVKKMAYANMYWVHVWLGLHCATGHSVALTATRREVSDAVSCDSCWPADQKVAATAAVSVLLLPSWTNAAPHNMHRSPHPPPSTSTYCRACPAASCTHPTSFNQCPLLFQVRHSKHSPPACCLKHRCTHTAHAVHITTVLNHQPAHTTHCCLATAPRTVAPCS